MGSPNTINYEIRPCKFVERRILLASLYQIVVNTKLKYQYIGFGGLTFTDFKLFHKELNIDKMFSIDACFTPQKLEFNKPFSCITILHGMSNNMLTKINLKEPSIVWLDYDGVLTMDIFSDIYILFNNLPHGSVYIMSCNRLLQNENEDGSPETYTNEEFQEKFKNIVPFDIGEKCCADINAPTTIKRMVDSFCQKTISDRNKSKKTDLKYKPLYNIMYEDGAKMFTCGGIIINNDFDEKQLFINNFDYLNSETPLKIEVPNITHKEALYLNQILNIENEEKKFYKVMKKKDIDKYKKFYKYMPNFYDVRL